jgi:hypothetical protein
LKADPFQIGDVLKNPKRFIVPIYQRTYTWEIKPHLETFFDQVEAKAKERLKGDGHFPHYMGATSKTESRDRGDAELDGGAYSRSCRPLVRSRY